jgi:hypothetical protein
VLQLILDGLVNSADVFDGSGNQEAPEIQRFAAEAGKMLLFHPRKIVQLCQRFTRALKSIQGLEGYDPALTSRTHG